MQKKGTPMALINCPECGHQISDAAKKCPHCGYKRKKANPKIIGLITFGIGICLLIFSLGLITNTAPAPINYESDIFRAGIIITFSTILGLFIFASFIKKHIPKSLKVVTLISLIDIILISLSFAFQGLENNAQMWERMFRSYETNTYENQMEQTDNSQKYFYISTSDYYGTYEYIQPQNQDGIQSLKLVINPDETVRAIINKNGTELIAYGSYWVDKKYGFHLSFNDTEEHINGILYVDHLRVYQNFSKYFGIKYGYIKYDKDERKLYLYEDSSHGDAKDPTKRVELQKIE